MGVPLVSGRDAMGMIALANKEGGYDSVDQKAVESLGVAIVEALRSKRAEKHIHSLSQQLIVAHEDERQMISRELHDRVAQDLSTLKIGMDSLYDHEPSLSPKGRKTVSENSKILQKAIESVRDLSYDLHPPGLDDMGVIEALSMYCKEFSEKNGMTINFKPVGMTSFLLDAQTAVNLYRLVQEGLNNIFKHAASSQATVKLMGTYPNIILRIEDNGKGFEVQKRAREADAEKRMGLRSMAERVALMQGKMRIQSQSMKGTRVFIKFPYREKPHGS
jgi:signal transduction histidine kinase